MVSIERANNFLRFCELLLESVKDPLRDNEQELQNLYSKLNPHEASLANEIIDAVKKVYRGKEHQTEDCVPG